jgi:hypothetical protein
MAPNLLAMGRSHDFKADDMNRMPVAATCRRAKPCG